jgi:hypothetical protein
MSREHEPRPQSERQPVDVHDRTLDEYHVAHGIRSDMQCLTTHQL